MVITQERAIIIGAGPAGLTAAYELLTRTGIAPIVLEKSTYMGGIARTHKYKGNRIDIGGHRFFSKSDRVMQWWLDRIPLQRTEDPQKIAHQGKSRYLECTANGPDPEREDRVMLLRKRKSRIYFLRRFFEYPIRLDGNTISALGLIRMIRIVASYLKTVMFPPKEVENLEQFFISRFGKELYLTFFKSYTEKVWGTPCHKISAEWGAQRIKGLSITRAVLHFAKRALSSRQDIAQKDTETSLIEQFLYPKFGPGQMWEHVAAEVQRMGGEVLTGWNVESVETVNGVVKSIAARHDSGATRRFEGEYFFSTMPVQELVNALETPAPADVKEVSDGLVYRDFITVGLLLNKLKARDAGTGEAKPITDNWIYIQEPDVHAGRLQIFNNWSPYMVADPSKTWVGVEYFCYETDKLWKLPDQEMAALAAQELDKIGIIDKADVVDSTVLRMPKTYPAYFGTYAQFDKVREYLSRFDNLFLVGRNGMHKYNNQDHSMLTAMIAVDNIIVGRTDKTNLWDVNTEMEYHEQTQKEPAVQPQGVPLPQALSRSVNR
jgi:protoporphyrinogen oxidase